MSGDVAALRDALANTERRMDMLERMMGLQQQTNELLMRATRPLVDKEEVVKEVKEVEEVEEVREVDKVKEASGGAATKHGLSIGAPGRRRGLVV